MSSRPTRAELRPGAPIRRLPSVLREAFAERSTVRLEIGEVVGIPDPAHVAVQISDEDAPITVPKLKSYDATVGEPAYLLVSGYYTLAIGTVSL